MGGALTIAALAVHGEPDRGPSFARGCASPVLIAPPSLRFAASPAKRSSGRSGIGVEADAGRVADGIQNRGRGAVVGQFADAFGAESAIAEGNLLEVHMNRRNILGSGHNVVGHLVVGHAAVLPDDFFVERIADALRDAAFDLPGGHHRMQYAAHFLHGPEIFDLGGISDRVDGDLRHVNGPRIRADRPRRDISDRPRRCRAALRSGTATPLRRALRDSVRMRRKILRACSVAPRPACSRSMRKQSASSRAQSCGRRPSRCAKRP